MYADLIQEGNIGLLEAVGTYEGKDEEEFLKYAARAVEEAMLNSNCCPEGIRQHWRTDGDESQSSG